jgi:hypothetical protein
MSHHLTEAEHDALLREVRQAVRLALDPILERLPIPWCLHCLHGTVTQALGEVLATHLALTLDAVEPQPQRASAQAEELALVLAGIAQATARERDAVDQIRAARAAERAVH